MGGIFSGLFESPFGGSGAVGALPPGAVIGLPKQQEAIYQDRINRMAYQLQADIASQRVTDRFPPSVMEGWRAVALWKRLRHYLALDLELREYGRRFVPVVKWNPGAPDEEKLSYAEFLRAYNIEAMEV